MYILMKTDTGNGRTIDELYKLPKHTDMEDYASNMIKNYNNTIVSPFDMPRKLISVKEATLKDCLESLLPTKKFDNISNCWISPYGQVFPVAAEGHDNFIYGLIEEYDWFDSEDLKDVEDGGWVRVTTSRWTATPYIQCLKRMKPKQKIAVEKILSGNVENFFGIEKDNVLHCRECIFSYENEKVKVKQLTERDF